MSSERAAALGVEHAHGHDRGVGRHAGDADAVVRHRAAAMPATCVPWPFSSCGPAGQSPFEATMSVPATSFELRSGWPRSTPVSTTAMVVPAPLRAARPRLGRVDLVERPLLREERIVHGAAAGRPAGVVRIGLRGARRRVGGRCPEHDEQRRDGDDDNRDPLHVQALSPLGRAKTSGAKPLLQEALPGSLRDYAGQRAGVHHLRRRWPSRAARWPPRAPCSRGRAPSGSRWSRRSRGRLRAPPARAPRSGRAGPAGRSPRTRRPPRARPRTRAPGRARSRAGGRCSGPWGG